MFLKYKLTKPPYVATTGKSKPSLMVCSSCFYCISDSFFSSVLSSSSSSSSSFSWVVPMLHVACDVCDVTCLTNVAPVPGVAHGNNLAQIVNQNLELQNSQF
jgi:hypothetical protein